MAENPLEPAPPPPSEEIHLPGPTYIPVVAGLGITLFVSGIVLSFVLSGIGLVIFLAALVLWIRDTRRDIAELPLEH